MKLTLLSSAAALLATAALTTTTSAQTYDITCDATVDINNGAGQGGKVYTTVGAAINAIPSSNAATYVVCVQPGNYTEVVTVDVPYVKIVGNSSADTIISAALYAGQSNGNGGTLGTSNTATVNVLAPYFWAENITFQNSWAYMTNLQLPKANQTSGSQALALLTAGNSSQASFYNVRLMGFQDTLEAQVGSQYYKNCWIEGNVDFIFGSGQAVFDSCTIMSLDRGQKATSLTATGVNAQAAQNGYVTAPSTSINNQFGYLFINSQLLKNSTVFANFSVGLGRPWHPTIKDSNGISLGGDPNAIGQATYINCFMDSHIIYAGWATYSAKYANGTAQPWIPNDPAGARFYEYGSYGPGAANLGDSTQVAFRPQLSQNDATNTYTIKNVLGGWTPLYTSGKTIVTPAPTTAAPTKAPEKTKSAALPGAAAGQWVAAAVVAAALLLL